MEDLDKIFEEVNGHGKFQRIFLYAVVGPIFAALAIATNTELLILNQNDHWCYHPMTEGLNETELVKWKNCYLPLTESNKSSSCEIYAPYSDVKSEDLFWNQTSFSDCPWDNGSNTGKTNLRSNNDIKRRKLPCNNEWSYDHSEFKRTLVSDLNWVCNSSDLVQLQFTWGGVGKVIGSVVMNVLADKYGRKSMLWVSITMVIVPLLLKTFLYQYYYLYTILNVVMQTSSFAVYQIPSSLMMEIVDEPFRAWVMMYSPLIWMMGNFVLSFIGWMWGDWFVTSLIGAGGMTLLFIAYPFIIESPRWLLGQKGRIKEVKQIIKLIAKTNKKLEPSDLDQRLKTINDIIMKEPKHGILSLFNRFGMGTKTVLLLICLTANEWIYSQMLINLDNMAGNYFLNFFLMSMFGFPACFFGLWLSDKFGRRWSQSGLILSQAIVLALACTMANSSDKSTSAIWGIRAIVLLGKLFNSSSLNIAYLQIAEIYPTSIRNTGTGFLFSGAMFLGVPGAYITGLGKKDKNIPYIFMAGMGLVASITSSFIPETLGCYLPETVEQASEYGRDHKYFSFKVNKEEISVINEDIELENNLN